MRRIYGYFTSLFLVAALAAPLVCTGCAVRVRDRDYRHGQEGEELEHQQYRHNEHRYFYQLNFIGSHGQGIWSTDRLDRR
jgi:hypothetical protein